MSSQRVWLSGWEWSCCGDPFRVGDDVSFWVDRPIEAWLAELVGPTLAETLDAVESHHEDGGVTSVKGTVRAIHGVTIEHIERRVPRPQRASADRDAPGEFRLSAGWAVRSGADTDYVRMLEPVPGTAKLHPISRVPWPPRENEGVAEPAESDLRFTGYVVDLSIGGESAAGS